MMIRFIILSCTILTLTSLSVTGQKNKKSKSALPNIIYIYADDLGYGELGSYGQKKIKTPHLDQMAREGMRFTDHYTGTPVCAPARAMLMLGLHGGHSPIRGNFELGGFKDEEERGQKPLPDESFTVAELLKQKGYATALTGKWGMGMGDTEGTPTNQGYDYYYGYLDQKQAHNLYPSHLWENNAWDTLSQPWFNVHVKLDPKTATKADFDAFKGKDYAPQKMTEKALEFIDKSKNGPFFLYMPYSLPHVSLQAPEAYIEQYKGQFDENPYYGQQGYAPTQYPFSTYAAMITFLDAQVGMVMEKIKSLGLDDNTIIMFSSDNGTTFNGGVDAKYFNSVGELRGLKMDVYEGGIREPFIARWPGKIKPNRVTGHLSAQYDLMATLAELTGQQTPPTDGISFLPELLGKKNQQKKHKFLYFEYPEKGGQLAIRLGKWKGVKVDLKNNPSNPWQLFDLETDRNETNDLAAKHPDILKKMDAIVKKEHTETPVKKWQFVSEVIAANEQ